MDWTGGLLQALGGAGQGGAAAVQSNNKDKLEALKAEAAKAREDFLLNLQRGWAKEDTKDAQDFTTATNETANNYNKEAAGLLAQAKAESDKMNIDTDKELTYAKIKSADQNSANSISAQERMNAASTGATLEAARIRSKDGGITMAQQIAAAKQREEMIAAGDVPLERINEFSIQFGLNPLEEDTTGTKETDSGWFGSDKSLEKKYVPAKGKIEANSAAMFDSIAQNALGKKSETEDPGQPEVTQPEKAQPEKEKQQGLLVTPETETAEPDAANLIIDDAGVIWEKTPTGTTRYMVKPDERINTSVVESRGGNQSNPEYEKYLELVKQIKARKK